MQHKRIIVALIALSAAVFMLGCDVLSTVLARVSTPTPASSAASVPLAATPASTTAPASKPPTAAPQAGASTPSSYDGEWKGKNSSDQPVSFIIENNQVTYITVNFYNNSGECRGMNLFYGNSVNDAPVKGKQFSAQSTFSDGVQVTLLGTFNSNAEASGTLEIKNPKDKCGNAQGTWTAKIDSASTQGANSAPASAPSSEDSEKVVRAFFDAVNAKNLDAALALVDDDVVYTVGTSAGIGKSQLKSYLQGQVSRGVTYTLSNIQKVDDETVLFSLKAGNTTSSNNTAGLTDGKIDILTLH